MSQPPEDPHIPTLTQVVKSAVRAQACEPSAGPKPGLTPMDLDIDLPLEQLDATVSLAPRSMGEALLEPITPARPSAPDEADQRARIEACVDAALAAQIPALRDRLVEAVIEAMYAPDRETGE
ncbi:MAG: hypothetical protein ABR558_10295 [Thioalkalivibrio sp.]